MRLMAPLVLGLLLLAGCSSQPDNTVTIPTCDQEPVLCDPESFLANHPCVTGDVRPRVYAPDTAGPDSPADPWELGDTWTYELKVGGTTRTTVLGYYKDTDFDGAGKPQHYLVGTTSADEALDHALFSVNPLLGRIHRALYSPHEAGRHADMFNFPLCEGSAWSTNFYDRDFAMRAKLEPVAVPGAGQDPLGFRIAGTASDGSKLTVLYAPTAKWFTRLELERDDGLSLRMVLQSRGNGPGTYHFLRAQQDEVIDVAAIGQPFQVVREDGGEGPYDRIAISISAQRSGTGKLEVHVRDPAGNSVACVGFAGGTIGGQTTCPAGPVKLMVPYQEGTWTVTVEKPLGNLDSGTTATGEVRIVSVYDRGGRI